MEIPQEAAKETKESQLTLQQALKVLGFAQTGGEAKHMIQEGHVTVNGDVDTRRKRKIQEGDEICFQEECFVIELED